MPFREFLFAPFCLPPALPRSFPGGHSPRCPSIMKKTHLAHTLTLGLSTLALSACGGGGGDDGSTKITVLQVGDLVIERPANGGQPALTNSLLPTVLQPADKPNEQQHASLPQSPVLPQQSAGQASPPGGAQNVQSEQNVSTPPVTQPVPTHPEKPVSVNIATGNNGTATGGSSNTPAMQQESPPKTLTTIPARARTHPASVMQA